MKTNLTDVLTPSVISRIEASRDGTGRPLSDARKFGAYVAMVQDAWDTHPLSKRWDYKEHMMKREVDGMPSAGEIVEYLAGAGVHRYHTFQPF
jgi:hypothetical protein